MVRRDEVDRSSSTSRCSSPAGARGVPFIQKYGGRSVEPLYTVSATRMPTTAPGSLTPPVYAQITAYILQQNAIVAGTEELPSDPARLAGMTIPQGGRDERDCHGLRFPADRLSAVRLFPRDLIMDHSQLPTPNSHSPATTAEVAAPVQEIRHRLALAFGAALLAAGLILVTIILPAEYALDPLGTGARLGLLPLGETGKQVEALEAEKGKTTTGVLLAPQDASFKQESVTFADTH